MSRRGYIDHETGVVFFWSQKAACTTLFQTLTKNYGRENRFYHRESKEWSECADVIERRGYRSAVIVRNPYDRSVSCYINKFVFRRVPLVTTQDLEGFSRRLLRVARDLDIVGDGETNTLSFEGFLTTIDHLMSTRVDANENSVNGHWDTQIPPAAVGHSYDWVVHVENFTAEFSQMCDDVGLAYEGEAGNRTRYGESSSDYLGARPAVELTEMTLSKKNFRSDATDAMIRRMYEIDFRGLGYPT